MTEGWVNRSGFDLSPLGETGEGFGWRYNFNMQRKKFRIPRKKIAEFCKRWNILEFSLFGSALRDDFRPTSDVDVLVSIDPKAKIGLFEIAEMVIELEEMFKRPVDFVEKEGLRNPYRRSEILNTARVIYAAG